MAPPPITLDGARLADAMARVRALAAQRDAAKVYALLDEAGLADQLAPDDYAVGAAALHDVARRMADGEVGLADIVARIAGRVRLPERIRNDAVLVDYLHALIAAHEVLLGTPARDRTWSLLHDLLQCDLGAVPGVREHVLGFAAEAALADAPPPEIDAALLRYVDQPYAFSEPRAYLNLLVWRLDRAVRDGDTALSRAAWLLDWAQYVSSAPFARPRRARHRRSLLEMKDAAHAQARRFFKLRRLVVGPQASLRAAVTLLLIRLDCLVWRPGRPRPHDVHYAWLWVLRVILRRLNGRRARHDPPPAVTPPTIGGLALYEALALRGTARDVLVTRMQGGLGDVMMMRPGLLARARATANGRLFFATHRDLFAVFSTDDPITLVDIETTAIDWTSFGDWINLTECPATRGEVQQLPRVRTNRIDLFARALGVTVGPLPAARTQPRPLDPNAADRAETLFRDLSHADKPVVGIQLRSAEPYRDAPQLLDIARALSERCTVVVFDNRPIARTASDRFVALTDEPLSVVIALIGRLDAVITCDSLAVHLAGAYGVPCVALFGPTSGAVRCDHYPTVRVVDAGAEFDCMPCWRNQFSKCRVSGGYDSVCMTRITRQQVEAALDDALGRPR